MVPKFFFLLTFGILIISKNSLANYDTLRVQMIEYILSDTSLEDKKFVLVKLNVKDDCDRIVNCVTYAENLYQDIKRQYGYDFYAYKRLMIKILNGDTVLSYKFFNKYLVNGFVTPKKKIEFEKKRGAFKFIRTFFCGKYEVLDKEAKREKVTLFDLVSTLFDWGVVYDFSNNNGLIYFNKQLEKKIMDWRKIEGKKQKYHTPIKTQSGVILGTMKIC